MEIAENYITTSFWHVNAIGIRHKINIVPDWTVEYAKAVSIPAKELVQTCKKLENQTGKKYFVVPGFKAFGPDLNCRDFQYEEGRLYVYSDPEDVMICNSGFHFCPNIADAFDYYPMAMSTPIALVFGIVSDDYESGFYDFKSADPSCNDRKPRIDKLCGAAIYISKILTHEEIIEGICKTLHIDKDLEFTIEAPPPPIEPIFPVWLIRASHEPDSRDLVSLFFNGISGNRCTVCGRRVCTASQTTMLMPGHPYRRVLIAGLPVCTSCALQHSEQIDQALTEGRTILLTLDKFEYRRDYSVKATLSEDRKRIDIKMTAEREPTQLLRLQYVWEKLGAYEKIHGRHIASMSVTANPNSDNRQANIEIRVSDNCGEALFHEICSTIVIADEMTRLRGSMHFEY